MPLESNVTDWIVRVNESISHLPSGEQNYWEKQSIYKVPARVTDLSSKAYQPLAVSFGPYHHDKDPHLRPMEDHKHRALAHFFKRSEKPLDHFLKSLREVAGDLKASYDALAPEWKEGGSKGEADKFLQMMITDGCFMLEILRYAKQEVHDYSSNDPIFSKHGQIYVLPNIRRDMLLLENQLPMLVLDRLVNECVGEKNDEYINGLILNFCSTGPNDQSLGKCLHVLDVFRKNLVQPTLDEVVSEGSLNNASKEKCWRGLEVFSKSVLMESEKKDEEKSEGSEEIIRSATELREHGIRLRKSKTNCLNNISFASGVLMLPTIVVDEDTESMFLNLIAFERSHFGAGNEVTSYIFFMDMIIDRGQDVALLHTKGIIQNAMESDEAAAKLFNSLAKDVMLDPDSSLPGVITEVRGYCKKRRHKWRAILMHTYFRNPWVIVSLIAAFILFGLTAIQTVYAVLG